ncbi:MAG: AAA family ATPase [Hyphomicrobiaceae bacterium]
MMDGIAEWLRRHGLEQHQSIFAENDIDLSILPEITEEDLASLGLSLGQRKKIARAIRTLSLDGAEATRAGDSSEPGVEAKAAPAEASRTVPVSAERRYVTVMFCDLVGSTELADHLDPEHLRELLNTYYKVCKEEISEIGGQIENFLGDGVVAYFGYPKAHEDDAERAVHAAFAIIDAAKKIDTAGQKPIQVRVGLASGSVIIEAMVSPGKWAEGSAAGRTMNLAARIQTIAQPNTVAADESTRRLLQQTFECSSLGQHELKGFERPTTVWQVDRANQTKSRFEATHEQSIYPLIGRKEELSILLARWRQVQSGSGQSVLVGAEAGIGKSRLLHEFLQQVGNTLVLRGQCLSYGKQTPYHPIIDLIKRLAGIREDDSCADKAGAISRLVGDNEVSSSSAPYLLYLLDALHESDQIHHLASNVRQARTFKAVIDFLSQLSSANPIVVAIEDIHWIDNASEALLAALVDQIDATSIFVIATHRSEYRAPWAGQAFVTQVTLSPLSRDESLTMLKQVVGEDASTPRLTEFVTEKAQGNALFIEELSRMVAAGGLGSGLPDTVQGVLNSRIDSLPELSRHALQTASVLGREFRLGVLEALWQNQESIHELVGELQRVHFLYRRIEEEDRILGFRHALIQDAAYESLLLSRRRQLHLDAAKAIEQLFPGDVNDLAAVLAHHFERAEDFSNAVKYSIIVVDRALRAYALTDAEQSLRRALCLLDALETEPDQTRYRLNVKLRLSQTLYLIGRFDESVSLMCDEQAVLERGDLPKTTGPCLFWFSHMLLRLARYNEASLSAGHAISQAEAVEDSATLGKAYGALCLEKCLTGSIDAANEAGRRSIEILKQCSEPYWLGMSEFYQGMVEITIGDFENAVTRGERASEIATAIADDRLKCYAKFLRAWAFACCGDGAMAIEEAEEAVRLAPDPTSRAYAMGFRAYAYLRAYDARALAALETAQREMKSIGFRPFEGLFLAFLSEAQRQTDNTELALVTAVKGIEAATKFHYPLGEGWARRAWGRAAIALGRAVDGEAAILEADKIFDRIGARHEMTSI